MFLPQHHGLHSIKKVNNRNWTNYQIPNGIQIVHDFRDGNGKVPASPVDFAGVRNDVLKVVSYPINVENCGVRNDEIKTVSYPVNSENCGVRNDVVNTISYPINRENCGIRNDVISVEIVV